MKLRFSTSIAALACVLIASCYPYNENQQKKQPTKPAQKTVTSPEQQRIQEQRDQMKAQEEQMKKEAAEKTNTDTTGTTPGGTGGTVPPPKPPVEEKRTDYAFASKVPGKEGFVFSPYNNKIVDVRDIPSGTLVQDPTYTGAGKGYFRVP